MSYFSFIYLTVLMLSKQWSSFTCPCWRHRWKHYALCHIITNLQAYFLVQHHCFAEAQKNWAMMPVYLNIPQKTKYRAQRRKFPTLMSPQYIVDMILANANKRIFTQNWMLYQKIRVPSPPPAGCSWTFSIHKTISHVYTVQQTLAVI